MYSRNLLNTLFFLVCFEVLQPSQHSFKHIWCVALYNCMKHHERQAIKYWSGLQIKPIIFTVWTKFCFVNGTQNLVQTWGWTKAGLAHVQ